MGAAKLFIQVAAAVVLPVDQWQKACERCLCCAHPGGQLMWMAIGPAHAPAGTPCCKVRPLHVPEVLIVERLRQRDAPILEQMDLPTLLLSKKGTHVVYLC